MDVDRKPQHGKQCDDENEETTNSLLPAERLSAADTSRSTGALTPNVDKDADREGANDGERKGVGEREERGEETTANFGTDDVAVWHGGWCIRRGTVGGDDGHVEQQHGGPDACDDGGGDARSPITGRARGVHDGQVAHHGDSDQRVDGDVGRNVDEVVQQAARHVAERPPLGHHLVRRERRHYNHERQVGDGEIQQQQVRHCLHPLPADDDVDDKSVTNETRQ